MDQPTAPADWVDLGRSWGVAVTPEQAARLGALASWLAERAFPLGLTNYRTTADLSLHALLPTLALFRLPASPLSGPVLDLGAGSGVLGLTLAIVCPDLALVLADRRQRAATFMNLTRVRLHLDNVEVRQVSAQELAKTVGGSFSVVCFRALAPAETALGLARPLLRPEGWVAVWHQTEDRAYRDPPAGWTRRATVVTALPALAVSRLEIVSRETIEGSARDRGPACGNCFT